ncbi:hypothetical protein MIMGU_mgv1a017540mg [Erythranthe guttata]|uniref:Uncharacterized protein n=1 Tax=Erythranthe guttata TaxID=4155 RepID=A0A022R1C8_ERYGU|nr:hypothetical protein MIMGU_mgv1a017540mg [Erythranthe guttata]
MISFVAFSNSKLPAPTNDRVVYVFNRSCVGQITKTRSCVGADQAVIRAIFFLWVLYAHNPLVVLTFCT